MKMKFFFVSALSLWALAASAQEFTSQPRVAPQPIPPRSAVEENSNTSVINKVYRSKNKFQNLSPLAPSKYGSGSEVVQADPEDPKEKARFWRLLSFTF